VELLYLIAVFYGLFLLVLPVWLIALSVRAGRLRRELSDVRDAHQREQLRLQRAMGELQTKLASLQSVQPATEKPAAETHTPKPEHQAPGVPSPSFTPAPIPPSPSMVPRAFTPAPPPPAPPPKPAVPSPSQPAAQPPLPEPPAVVTTPVHAATKPVEPPPAPAHPPTPPPQSLPAGTLPTVPPRPAVAVPPVAAHASTPISPLRSSALPSSFQKPAKTASSIEELLGKSWFAILGVIMTVIGLALLGKLVLQNVGPAGKALLIYAVAAAFLGTGICLEKRDRYQLLGRVGIGGGWALLFFSTFGIFYVPAMRVVDSALLDSILMLVVAVAMGAHTLRYNSQLVTGMAFLLGYTTVALSQDTVYSLTAGVMLGIGLVAIVLKMGWYQLEVFGILASYGNHLYWLYRILGPNGAHGRAFPEYHPSLALLFFYWLVFRLSYVARDIKNDLEEHVSTVACILNTLLLLGVMKFQSVNPELAYLALFALGAFEIAFALLPITRKRRRAFVLLSIMGSALMVAAVPSHFSGNPVAILWLIGAEVFLAAGILFDEVVFRRLGLFAGLLVGVDLFGFNLTPLVDLRAKSEALALATGVLFALCAVVFYLNALFVSSRWKKQLSQALDENLLIIHSYLAAAAGATAVWALCSNDWTAVAFAAAMLALAALNRRVASWHLQAQMTLLGALTLYRVLVFNIHLESPSHLHIVTRLVTLPLIGALFYGTAKLAALGEDQAQKVFRAIFSFAGAAMFGLLIWTESPELWIASLFLLAAVLLALVARRLHLFHLSVQEHLFALAAFFQTLAYNFRAPGHYGPFTLRLLSVALVAAGFYAISRRAALADAGYALVAAYLHTTAATFLITLLMWYESSTWLAALWVIFALVLTALDRRFHLDDLRFQAHVLSLLTLVRCITFSIYSEDLWHGIHVRLLTLALVAVIFYAMSQLIRMPEEWRARDFHHIYSWSASFLASLLLWYELDPVSRALGWAIFGLVLFEYGFLRKVAQYRYQAYVAFTAAFARIFFANLTAGMPGEFLSERMYTVAPLILIFFFVYAQLSGEESSALREKRFRSDVLLAYLGTATLVALAYFQFDPDLVVVAYAALVFVLFAVAWALRRSVFLHQGLLLTLLTFFRGITHNLFGASYLRNVTFSGRYSITTAAIAILFASLFFAFKWRNVDPTQPDASRNRLLASLLAHPERLQFFAPVTLLTVMLALKTEAGMITFSCGVEGVFIVLFALLVRERVFLQGGFCLLVLCVAKTIGMDIWHLDLLYGTITFIGVGLATTVTSLLYVKYQDNLKRYL